MWKFLLLGTTLAADALARVGRVVGKPCVCGQPCTMNGGGSGVCQENGDCAVNILPPNCGGGGLEISSTLSAGKNCPMLRCAAPPDCPKMLLWTPSLANGCPGCPQCRDRVAASSEATVGLEVASDIKVAPPNCPLVKCIAITCPAALQETPTTAAGCKLCPVCKPQIVTAKPPCPVFKCIAPGCPVSQQETPKDENGCSLCPKCKGVSTVPPVFTAAPGKGNANFDLDLDLTGVVCPQLACLPLNCPLAQQMPTKAANGCGGCPKCREIVAAGGKAGKAGGKVGKGKNNANPCATVKCSAGHHCDNGQCVADNTDPCALVRCAAGFTCRNGNCVANTITQPSDPCALVRCASGFTCKNGQCVANTITQPVNSCALILCLPNTRCENGQCVPINPDSSCAAVTCLTGWACVNGRCVANTLSGGR